MSTLYVYRASAGSGKTHFLVKTYIKLALSEPLRFQQILAVTFTNKSTQELKTRILGQLYILAQGLPSPLVQEYMDTQAWTKEFVQTQAQLVLSNILHHYTYFAVSTIDSFFQSVVRSFGRELGLHTGYIIETDQEAVLQILISQLIAKSAKDKELQSYLLAFAERKLFTGQNWDVGQDLLSLGHELFSEKLIHHQDLIQHSTTNKPAALDLIKKLHGYTKHFENTLQAFGIQALQHIHDQGFVIQDFAYGSKGIIGYFIHLKNKTAFAPTIRAKQGVFDQKAWYTKAASHNARLVQLVEKDLQGILKNAIDFYQSYAMVYYTGLAIHQLSYALGVSRHLLEELGVYRHTHASILLRDATAFLQDIIQENDSPFIYEKLGNFYKHFLIDEFQDISVAQWNSLKPLIKNSVSENYPSFIVGDAKQSIYRWRGGDSNLLTGLVKQEMMQTQVQYLSHNWRSHSHIIHFNNALFTQIPGLLAHHLTDELSTSQYENSHDELYTQVQQLEAVYQDSVQELAYVEQNKGYIQISFIPVAEQEELQDWRTIAKARLIQTIERVQIQGFQLQDIAILVRDHMEAQEIVEHLLLYKPHGLPGLKYDAISIAALSLYRSPWIKILINALKYLFHVQDDLVVLELIHLYQQHVLVKLDNTQAYFLTLPSIALIKFLPQDLVLYAADIKKLAFYEVLERLITIFQLNTISSAGPFIHMFKDLVLEFIEKEQGTVVHFLDWWVKHAVGFNLHMGSQDLPVIQVMTIHAAKGLEFPIVILPFCSWDLDHNVQRPPIIWAHNPLVQAYDMPALAPLYYTKSLEKTFYKQAYFQEKVRVYLDNINLLYVAFTRAIQRLYVFAGLPNTPSLHTTADVLYQTFTQSSPPPLSLDTQSRWQMLWQDQTNTLIIGHETPVTPSLLE